VGIDAVMAKIQIASEQIAEGYIDDTDAVTADQQTQPTDTPEIITEQMQNIAQTWSDLICGSGGEVSMAKSCWWLVWWNWTDGVTRLATIEEVNAQIYLRNGRSPNLHLLKRKQRDESICQLGLLNNTTRKLDEDFDKRYSTNKKMSIRIQQHFIKPKNAWQIYQNVWLPWGQYPLAVTRWSKKECEKLMSPFLLVILPNLGLNHHFPHVVVHEPMKYGGLQMAVSL
jgi:hypothetical protein